MGQFVLGRIAMSIPTLLGAFALIFLMTRLVPGDPALIILEENYTQDSYEAVQQQLGLDKPVWQQFTSSLTKAMTGDLGSSFQNKRPVWLNIQSQLGDTLQLTVAALVIAAAIGIPAGIISALRRNSWVDYSAMVGALLALCAPSFWLGAVFIIIFSLNLGWFPAFGSAASANPWEIVKYLALPGITLGAAAAGLVARITRSSMLEVLSQDYVRTGRAKGLTERTVTYKHALRNAMIPIATIFGVEVVALLTGAVVVETVFARPGIGRLLVEAILSRDYPQIQGILILFVVLAVVVNLLVDIAYGIIDPRIRHR
jgi:peptide/nickel transport system permease protein